MLRILTFAFLFGCSFVAGVAEEVPDAAMEGVDSQRPLPEEFADEGAGLQNEERGWTPVSDEPLSAGVKTLIDEWDVHMADFTPELLLTVPLPARTDEFFYEDVPKGPPVLIRGGFFASSEDETSSVDFTILDPKSKTIYEKHGEPEGLFHFQSKMPGTYTIIVSNHKWMTDKMVTLAVGKGNVTHLQPSHLTTVLESAQAIEKTLVDIQTESTYLWIRQRSHMKAVESIHTRVLAFCVVEFLVLLSIAGFQVYYIKGLLSDRRVL